MIGVRGVETVEAMVGCPGCTVALRVPFNSSGHAARCPACGKVFLVPKQDDLLDSTIGTWIATEVDQLLEEHEQEHDRTLRPRFAMDEHVGKVQRRPESPTPPKRDGTAGTTQAAIADTQPPAADVPEALAEVEPAELAESAPAADQQPAASQVPPPAEDQAEHLEEYDQSFDKPHGCPHLVVHQVDHTGVTFSFYSRWLEHEGFRASFPVQCAFSGNEDRSSLVARPMVFLDQAKVARATLESVTAGHELRGVGRQHPRQLLRTMGSIEQLRGRFGMPMPYYVHARYAHLWMHGETHQTNEGRTICRVLVPDAATALKWLANVNGITGDDYRKLEHDVGLLHGEAWQKLSEQCRLRINVWCKLRPREEMRLYLSDADFGKRDEGLAGIVVTDQRIVYSKYHHRGQIDWINEQATIHVRKQGRFANLKLAVDRQRSRMVKIHVNDIDRLADALDGGKVKLEIDEA